MNTGLTNGKVGVESPLYTSGKLGVVKGGDNRKGEEQPT